MTAVAPVADDALSLEGGAATLGCPLSGAQVAALLRYRDLLVRWNRVHNLTAVRDPSAMLTQHLLDSLSVLVPLRRHAEGRSLRVLDVGSGGGLPGVVLAIAAPELQITCIDAVAKKAGFVRQAAVELSLANLQSLHSRVEDLDAAPFDVITSRAFASLADFVAWTRPLLAVGGVWMAMKGQHPQVELSALPADVKVFHVERLTVPGLGAERCLVWMASRAGAQPETP